MAGADYSILEIKYNTKTKVISNIRRNDKWVFNKFEPSKYYLDKNGYRITVSKSHLYIESILRWIEAKERYARNTIGELEYGELRIGAFTIYAEKLDYSISIALIEYYNQKIVLLYGYAPHIFPKKYVNKFVKWCNKHSSIPIELKEFINNTLKVDYKFGIKRIDEY